MILKSTYNQCVKWIREPVALFCWRKKSTRTTHHLRRALYGKRVHKYNLLSKDAVLALLPLPEKNLAEIDDALVSINNGDFGGIKNSIKGSRKNNYQLFIVIQPFFMSCSSSTLYIIFF